MSQEFRRWVVLPLAVIFLSLYLFGLRVYQNRSSIEEPPPTVLTEEQMQNVTLVEGETISINDSDIEDLKRIPGIGDVLAKRICSKRDELGGFHSVDELKTVKGIGDKLYQKIEKYIVIE